MAEKADFARVEERATLRHKTVSKKLRFYDQTNTKESAVRRTQNLESQKLSRIESLHLKINQHFKFQVLKSCVYILDPVLGLGDLNEFCCLSLLAFGDSPC